MCPAVLLGGHSVAHNVNVCRRTEAQQRSRRRGGLLVAGAPGDLPYPAKLIINYYYVSTPGFRFGGGVGRGVWQCLRKAPERIYFTQA